MMNHGTAQKTLFVVLAFILLSLSSFVSVWAEDYTSDSFILRDPVISIEGGRSTSSSFEYFSTTGPTIKTENTSLGFIQRVGFLYFPIATSPVLSALAGDGQVDLTWTASVATLANITDYQVGTATVSNGPYTFESVGNALSFTKTGLANSTTYYFKIKALAGTLVLAQSDEASATSGAAGPTGGRTPLPRKTKVIFQGKAYPDSLVTILKDAKVAAVVQADSKADFIAEIANLTTGSYTFGVWAKDNEGRKSITISFTINASSRETVIISDVFLPPTIELEKNSLEKGEFLNISGQTAPGSEVDILIDSAGQEIVKKTKAEADGKWSYSFDTTILDKGIYSVKVKAVSPEGLISSFSEILIFYYIEEAPVEEICPRGDLNYNDRVNLVDFSILLYWWGRANACADQNRNGTVDLPDFSIMMYYWTG